MFLPKLKYMQHRVNYIARAQHIPLTNGLGQEKLPMGQVDFGEVYPGLNIPHCPMARGM